MFEVFQSKVVERKNYGKVAGLTRKLTLYQQAIKYEYFLMI